MNLGLQLQEVGRPIEALSEYEKALEIMHRLVEDYPTVTRFQSLLAICYGSIGGSTNESNLAKSAYEKALEIAQRLVDGNPTVGRFQLDLANCHINIGILMRQNNEMQNAMAAFEKVTEILKGLLDANPTDSFSQNALVKCYQHLGVQQLLLCEPNQAMATFEQALELVQRLVDGNPESTEFNSQRSAILFNVISLELEYGKLEKAYDYIHQDLQRLKKEYTADSANPNVRKAVRLEYHSLLGLGASLRDGVVEEVRQGLADFAASDPLANRMSSVFGGQPAKDGNELLLLSRLAYDMGLYAMAARWFGEALHQEPTIADDRESRHAYNAACYAALAASGQGRDEPATDETARSKLRGQALTWLQAELDRWASYLKNATPEQRPLIVNTLHHWQSDWELAGIRNAEDVAKLAEPERAQFESLWKRVAELLAKASVEPHN